MSDELHAMIKAICIMAIVFGLVVLICVVSNIEGDVEAAPEETTISTVETTEATEETIFVTEPPTEPMIEETV